VKDNNILEQVAADEKLAIPPQVLGAIIKVEEPLATEKISISLEWSDPQKAADLINHLMDVYVERLYTVRQATLNTSYKETEQITKECSEVFSKARTDYDNYLEKAGIVNLKTELEQVTKDRSTTETTVISSKGALSSLETQIRLHNDFIDNLKTKGLPGGKTDATYLERVRELQLKVNEEEAKLNQAKSRYLASAQDLEVDEKLLKAGAVAPDKVKQLRKTVDDSAKEVKGQEENLRIRKEALDFAQKNPASPQIQDAMGELRRLESQLAVLKGEAARNAVLLDVQKKEINRLTAIQKQAEPLESEMKRRKEALDAAEANLVMLGRLRSSTSKDFTVFSSAKAGGPPTASTARKIMIMTFAAPMALVLAAIVGLAMLSPGWKGEAVASMLGLPVLARAAPRAKPLPPGKGNRLNQEEARGLALRLRQYVTEDGGSILFSSITDDEAVDDLLADVGKFLAMRDEKVLILDTRIANPNAASLARLVERPVEVVAGEGNSGEADGFDPCQAGLVQYLVFEGQASDNFIHRTLTRGLEFMPAGGPYHATDALASEPMKELLDSLKQKYTVILVAGPAVSQTIDTEILAAYVQGIVVIINGSPVNTAGTAEFISSLKSAEAPLIGSVICV
jgi:Mrp family chromosome partitioning ATPase